MTCDRRRDADLVAAIVAELEKGGALNDPRRPEYPPTLRHYAKTEVQRSLDTVRLLQTWKPPADVPPTRTAADYRAAAKKLGKVKAAKELRKIGADTFLEELAGRWAAVEQEPPERVNAPKYQCTAEAYYLMERFSATAPTGYKEGSFRKIAALIFEALTGDPRANMKRACDAVLERRRGFPHRFTSQPRSAVP